MTFRPCFNNITVGGVTYRLGDVAQPPCRNLHADPLGHLHFWCAVADGISGTSSSPRCEFRETEADTSASRNWFPGEFTTSRLVGRCRVRRVPSPAVQSSGKVIFGQIHASGAAAPFVKLYHACDSSGLNGEIRVEVRFRPGDANPQTVIRQPYQIGDVIEYSLEVTGGGQLVIGINGYRFETPTDVEWSVTPFYFKAGAYVAVGNGGAGLSDPETEGGWVVYEVLEVLHA